MVALNIIMQALVIMLNLIVVAAEQDYRWKQANSSRNLDKGTHTRVSRCTCIYRGCSRAQTAWHMCNKQAEHDAYSGK